jgi:hypothetical protein
LRRAINVEKEYDFSKMPRIPNPFVNVKDENGNPVLKNYFKDLTDEEFNNKIKSLKPYQRKYAINRRRRTHT